MKNDPASADINDWICTYAMAVNEENAAGGRVVTASADGSISILKGYTVGERKKLAGEEEAM